MSPFQSLLVKICVLLCQYIRCSVPEEAYSPNSPHTHLKFRGFTDVNTSGVDVVTLEPATKQNVGGNGYMKEELVMPKDIPIIVWWSKWLNFYNNPKQINCGPWSCYSTSNRTWLRSPQTRVVYLYGTELEPEDMPLPRLLNHEWALLHEESPMNNYMLVHGPFLRLLNHTATFSFKSDFPLTSQSLPSLNYLTARQPVLLATKNKLRGSGLAPVLYVQSHCDVASDRDRYVLELMKHIEVDSYGACLNNKELPDNLKDPVQSMDSPDFLEFIARYKFHLSFENAICNDYMTEKLFRPLHVGSVPVYKGSRSAEKWMPNNHSLIMVDDFSSPEELAKFIQAIDTDDNLYESYLAYKSEGIMNTFLIEHLKNRPWQENGDNAVNNDFIMAFECYLCKSAAQRYQDSKGQGSATHQQPKIASSSHLRCPQPYPSVGDIQDLNSKDSWKKMSWIEDYWTGFDKARAVARMVDSGEKDPATFNKYWRNVMNES